MCAFQWFLHCHWFYMQNPTKQKYILGVLCAFIINGCLICDLLFNLQWFTVKKVELKSDVLFWKCKHCECVVYFTDFRTNKHYDRYHFNASRIFWCRVFWNIAQSETPKALTFMISRASGDHSPPRCKVDSNGQDPLFLGWNSGMALKGSPKQKWKEKVTSYYCISGVPRH